MMFYTGTLLPPLQKKLLKKMHSNYGPHSLREAFDMTLEFKKEYQITQPQSTFNIMETCYEETPEQEEFSMEEVQMRSQMQGQGQGQYQQGNHPQYQKRQYNNNGGQKSYQGNNYRNNPNQGYKSQYQQGPKQNQSYHPQNMKGFQGQGQGQVMQQPQIDCGIVLPSNFTLEQFVEISKALKKIEDKYTHPHPQRQASASHNTVTSQNKETQAPTMVTELTSQPSHINGSTQIGNITVDQFTTSMGHSMDHIIEALKETFSNTEAKEDSEATVVEPQ